MKQIEKLSNNSLSELQCLVGDIQNLISRDYSHGSGLMPIAIRRQLIEYAASLEAENTRREEEVNS